MSPVFGPENLMVFGMSRGDQVEDTTGGTVTTTETVIGTVSPFFGTKPDRARVTAAVLARLQVTATTKGSQGGVAIEFRLRKDTVSGVIMDTKSAAIASSAATPLIVTEVHLQGIDVPAIFGQTKSYVLTAKQVVGTNITATSEWDEMKLDALVASV